MHIFSVPLTPADLRDIGARLQAGGIALIPTDTVYGVAAAPAAAGALARIIAAKGRDPAKPCQLLAENIAAVEACAGHPLSAAERKLADAFWPGALTLIVRASDRVPRFMQAADGTVALRCSASPMVAALIDACGCPLATTSANTHGMPAPASWTAVEQKVLEGVDAAIDAGETPCQDASTIVSCVSGEVVIARHGALSEDDIQRVAKMARIRMQDRR